MTALHQIADRADPPAHGYSFLFAMVDDSIEPILY